MKPWLLFIIFGFSHCAAHGAPDPPFEELLRRAETILLARVVSTSTGGVTLQRTQLLRGTSDLELTVPIDRYDHPNFSLQPGVECFLLSQGDEKLGLPRLVLGCSFDSKAHYRGWMTLPIKRIGKEIYVGGIFSFRDHDQNTEITFGERGKNIALPLSYIRSLIENFPYGSVRPDH